MAQRIRAAAASITISKASEPANSPPAGYIWNNALAAGLTVRNYGYWVDEQEAAGPDGIQIEKVKIPRCAPITNMRYRSFDLDYPDVERARTFLEDVKQFEAAGKMPQLMILRMGNDHTNGTTPGKAGAAVAPSPITIMRSA